MCIKKFECLVDNNTIVFSMAAITPSIILRNHTEHGGLPSSEAVTVAREETADGKCHPYYNMDTLLCSSACFMHRLTTFMLYTDFEIAEPFDFYVPLGSGSCVFWNNRSFVLCVSVVMTCLFLLCAAS